MLLSMIYKGYDLKMLDYNKMALINVNNFNAYPWQQKNSITLKIKN